MCGIFGAIGNKLDKNILIQIADEAGKRGPHAHGVSWLQNGELRVKKGLGKINGKKFLADIDSNVIVGHCRLSTSGTPANMDNNQPMVFDGVAVAHNGNIKDCKKYANMTTECDSEILARVGTDRAVGIALQHSPMALIMSNGNNLIVVRSGQPLYFREVDGCAYFCSREFDGSKLLDNEEVKYYG